MINLEITITRYFSFVISSYFLFLLTCLKYKLFRYEMKEGKQGLRNENKIIFYNSSLPEILYINDTYHDM